MGAVRVINVLFLFLVLVQIGTAQEYTVKTGDLITVTVWERQTLSGTVKVDTNGNITLPLPIGSVSVVGLTATQITDLLTERIREYVVNPTVFVSISPAEGFNVHVLGEVLLPDFVKVPEGTTVQEVITRAGGFTPLADKRHIQLICTEETDSTKGTVQLILDFEQFIERTDRSANPILKSGDVLIIPRLPKSERNRYVNVMGAVAKPGTIDLEEPLPLVEVIAQAGGPSALAILKDVSILSLAEGKYSWKHVNFESFLTGEDPAANPDVLLGETVFVPGEPREKLPFNVNVAGQVARPSAYPVKEKSRLFDAIYQAGGFVDEAAIDKVTIIHRGPHSPVAEQVNVREYLISGDEKYNPLLAEGDTIFIPMSEDAKKIPSVQAVFFPTIRLSIIGEVTRPDIYRVSADASVLDVLKIAGGPTSQAELKKVTVIREIPEAGEGQQRQMINLEKVLTEGDFRLLPKLKAEDTIFVPRKTERTFWGTVVKAASDITTVTFVLLLLTGRVYR